MAKTQIKKLNYQMFLTFEIEGRVAIFWGHILGAHFEGTSKGTRGFICPVCPLVVPLKKIVPKRAQYGSPESRKHYIIKTN